MGPDVTPLKLSAAGIRVAGYMIESNLRVAHVFGQAALNMSPFSTWSQVQMPVPRPKAVAPSPSTKAGKKAPSGGAAPARKSAPAGEPAKAASSQESAKTALPQEIVKEDAPDSPVRRPRAPSTPPAMPDAATPDQSKATTREIE